MTYIYCTYTWRDGPEAENDSETFLALVRDEIEAAREIRRHLYVEADGDYAHHKAWLRFEPSRA
jgi:hypothetical protein